MKEPVPFSAYQKLAIAVLAITQFTVILDFMVISPLGDFLMKSMGLRPNQFGIAVSVYAFSAGISGLLTAGFADRFDRKKLLLFFYTGFIAGTLLCGFSHSYYMLLAARLITGLFGGVIGSISLAIVTDFLPYNNVAVPWVLCRWGLVQARCWVFRSAFTLLIYGAGNLLF